MFNINVKIFNVKQVWYDPNLLCTKPFKKEFYQTVGNIQKYVLFFVLEKIFSYIFVLVFDVEYFYHKQN